MCMQLCILFKRSAKFWWYELCYPPEEEPFLSILFLSQQHRIILVKAWGLTPKEAKKTE